MTIFLQLWRRWFPRPHQWSKWELHTKANHQTGLAAAFVSEIVSTVQRRRCETCGLYQEATLAVYGTSCDIDDVEDAAEVTI